MMQKRKLSSLLLISFIVVFAFSYAAANTVVYESKTVLRCDQVAQNVTASPTQEIAAFELVFVTSSGGVEASGLTVTAGPDVPTGWLFDKDMSRVDGTAPDTVRVWGLRLDPGLAAIGVGDAVVAVLGYETNDVCDPANITFEGAEWTDYINPVGTIETQFVDVAAALVPVAVTPGVVEVENADPFIATPIADDVVHWGGSWTGTADADDDDLPNLCEDLTYSLTTFPTGMTIDDGTGVITWNPVPGANVCHNTVIVEVEDLCNATVTDTFDVCVENDAPQFIPCGDPIYADPLLMCPGDLIVVGAGETAYGGVAADDPDAGPNPMQYNIIGWTGAGMPVMTDPNLGLFEWEVVMDYSNPVYVFEMTVEVTDNAAICDPCSPDNGDTALFYIEVVPLRFYITKEHGVPQGQFHTSSIVMPDLTYINHPMGGFEFLIQYDNSALTLMEVTPGDFIIECGWEYFTYRFGPFGNCGNACPSGMLRIVALAEYNNGPEHPTCFNNDPGFVGIADMKFLVSNDRTLECMFVPIRFFWIDCNDNSVSDVPGERLFIGRRVFDYHGDGGDSYVEITDPTHSFPSMFGPEAGCDEVSDPEKPPIYEFIDFFNGGFDIICSGEIDDRGDVNLDGVAYSIADAVMFTNYFIYGLSAFPTGLEDGSVAATDINADGMTLTVADLVYLIRVIVGDANPYDDPFVLKPVTTNYQYYAGVVTVEGEMGAAAFVFEGEVNVELLADGMDLLSHYDGDVTRAVVYSHAGNTFTGEVVRGDGMVSMELGSADGGMVISNWLPSEFALNQNYPNPFNPSTNVTFALPTAAEVNLTIYNVAGQVVDQMGGNYEAGVHEIVWNAGNNATGIYFYKLTAGDFSETKKMVLLK